MPIIVDPSALNPAPPVEAVSPDGLLRARLDEDNAGVLLEADYSVEPLVQAYFVRDREGWITYALGGTTPSWTWTPGSFGIANDAEEGSALGIQKDFGGIGTGLAPIKVRVVVEADEDLVATRFRVSVGGDFYDGETPKAGRTEYEFQAVNPAAGLSWVAVHLSGSVAGEQSFRIVEVTVTEVAAREDFDGGSIDAWSTYQNGGGGVVTLDYDANWDGVKVSWTSAASSVGAIWTLPEPLPGNRAYRVRFLVRGLTLNAQRLRVALAPPSGGSFDFLDLPNPRPVNRVWEVEGIVPKGQTLGRIFFYANGNVSANQTVIFARPVVEQAPPQAVRVLRGGTPILSGDPATAVGGKAVAYDHHAPLGVPSTWTAIPVYLDGRTAGETEGVSLTVPEPTGLRDVWIKSVSEPHRSTRVILTDATDTIENAGRVELTSVHGAIFPSGAFDLHQAAEWSVQIYSETLTREEVLALARSGVLLFQTRPGHDIPDMYCLAGNVSMTITPAGVRDRGRLWTLTLTEVAPPPTVDTPLFIPGRSYDDRAALGTYDQVQEFLPTYDDWIALQ